MHFSLVKKIWGPYLDLEESNKQEPKTKLQELSQQKFKILPEYKLIKKEGPPHSPTFTICFVWIIEMFAAEHIIGPKLRAVA